MEEEAPAKRPKGLTRDDILMIINSYTELLGDVLVAELDNIMKNMNVTEIDADFFPYLAAMSTLAFCAKDIDRDEIINLLNSADIEPNPDYLDRVGSFKIKNYLIYIHILYFIMDLGKQPTIEETIKIAQALGFSPDAKLANLVFDLYRKKHH